MQPKRCRESKAKTFDLRADGISVVRHGADATVSNGRDLSRGLIMADRLIRLNNTDASSLLIRSRSNILYNTLTARIQRSSDAYVFRNASMEDYKSV